MSDLELGAIMFIPVIVTICVAESIVYHVKCRMSDRRKKNITTDKEDLGR